MTSSILKGGSPSFSVGGHAWVATPTGCRLVGSGTWSGPPTPWSESTAPPPSLCGSDTQMDDKDMYGNKIKEVMAFLMGCSCFNKGKSCHFRFYNLNDSTIHHQGLNCHWLVNKYKHVGNLKLVPIVKLQP